MRAATASSGGVRGFSELARESLSLTREGLPACAAIVAAGLLPGFLLSALALAVLGLADQKSIQRAFLDGDPGPAAAFLAVGLANLACRLAALGALFEALGARAGGEALGPLDAFRKAWRDMLPNMSAAPAALRLVMSRRREAIGLLAAAAAAAAAAYFLISYGLGLFWAFCEALFSGEASVLESLLMSFVDSLVGGMVFAWLAAFATLLHRDLSGLRPNP